MTPWWSGPAETASSFGPSTAGAKWTRGSPEGLAEARLRLRRSPCWPAANPYTPAAFSAALSRIFAMKRDIKKVVLAYSGGLDTSVILKWLQTTYGCEVVTFTADLGQGEELEPARRKAEMFGVTEIFIDDLRETFVRDFVFPMFRANALYEGQYLLGTSIARPLIAQRQIEIAELVGADAGGARPPRQGHQQGGVARR